MHLLTDIPFHMSMTFTLTLFTILVDWLIDWLLFNANSAISWREQVNFQWDDDEFRFVLDQHTEVDFLLVLAHWNNSPRIYMSPYSDTLSWFRRQPLFALSSYCCMISGEATNTNNIVFGLTRSGLEHTIYSTRGEHANLYTTDAVQCL